MQPQWIDELRKLIYLPAQKEKREIRLSSSESQCKMFSYSIHNKTANILSFEACIHTPWAFQ